MSFNHAFDVVIASEGGHTNDQNDPGGETKYGICKRDYPHLDIQSLTIEDAKSIYRRDYWELAKCDLYPSPLDLCMFDAAVNQGVTTAIKLLQKALNVPQDGIIGPVTKRKITTTDIHELTSIFMADRALRYTGTRNFDRYGRGWLKRLFFVSFKS